MCYSELKQITNAISQILERLNKCENKLGMLQDKDVMVKPGDIVRAEENIDTRYYIVGRIGEETERGIRQYYILIDLLDGNRWSDVRIPFSSYNPEMSLKHLVGEDGWKRYKWTLVDKPDVISDEVLSEDANNA
jgi:hypothetical protein